MNVINPVIYGLIVLVSIWAIFYFIPIGIWFSAIISGVQISLSEIILMRFRKSPVKEIVNGLINSQKAGIQIDRIDLEAHGRAGGDINNVVAGMVIAKNAGFNLSFEKATTADLNGTNLVDAVMIQIEQQKKEKKSDE